MTPRGAPRESGGLDFAELVRLEPGLAELEDEVRAVEDDGRASFFCSNYVWLPIQARLRRLAGVHRRPRVLEGEAARLCRAEAFEVAYRHLSALLPACRGCGCRVFEPVRERQLDELARPSPSIKRGAGEIGGRPADSAPTER